MDADAARAQELARELQDLEAKQREVEERLRGPRPPTLLRRRHTVPGPGPGAGAGPGPLPRGGPPPAQRSFQRPPGLFQRHANGSGAHQGHEVHHAAHAQEEGENGEDTGSGSKRRRLQSLVALPGGDPMDQHSRWGGARNGAEDRDARGDRTRPEGREGGGGGGGAEEAVPPRPLAASDASTRKRNRKIFGALLLGTLERFRDEDERLQDSDAFTRRSLMLRRAEQKAQEEKEALRQHQRERQVEERRQDMMLRARLAAEAEAKDAQLLMLKWKQHHKALTAFFRTRSNPPIYFRPVGRPPGTQRLEEAQQERYEEWERTRAEELEAHAEENLKRHLQAVPAHVPLPGRGPGPAPPQRAEDGLQGVGGNSEGAGEGSGSGEARGVPSAADGGTEGGMEEAASPREAAAAAAAPPPDATGPGSDTELSGDSPDMAQRHGRPQRTAQEQGRDSAEDTHARTGSGPAAGAEVGPTGRREAEEGGECDG